MYCLHKDHSWAPHHSGTFPEQAPAGSRASPCTVSGLGGPVCCIDGAHCSGVTEVPVGTNGVRSRRAIGCISTQRSVCNRHPILMSHATTGEAAGNRLREPTQRGGGDGGNATRLRPGNHLPGEQRCAGSGGEASECKEHNRMQERTKVKDPAAAAEVAPM